MKIELIKASGRCMCRGENCPKNPKYIKLGRWQNEGWIIKDTTCAAIHMWSAKGHSTSYYCRDCLQSVHDQVRMILNPQLWVFM